MGSLNLVSSLIRKNQFALFDIGRFSVDDLFSHAWPHQVRRLRGSRRLGIGESRVGILARPPLAPDRHIVRVRDLVLVFFLAVFGFLRRSIVFRRGHHQLQLQASSLLDLLLDELGGVGVSSGNCNYEPILSLDSYADLLETVDIKTPGDDVLDLIRHILRGRPDTAQVQLVLKLSSALEIDSEVDALETSRWIDDPEAQSDKNGHHDPACKRSLNHCLSSARDKSIFYCRRNFRIA